MNLNLSDARDKSLNFVLKMLYGMHYSSLEEKKTVYVIRTK